MLRQKCAPHPLAIKTAAGGRKTARTKRMMLDCCVFLASSDRLLGTVDASSLEEGLGLQELERETHGCEAHDIYVNG